VPDDPTLPRYGLQLLLALVAAVLVTLGAVGAAVAVVDTAALCSDDSGRHGGDGSGHGSGD
jgi:hypothetical protein